MGAEALLVRSCDGAEPWGCRVIGVRLSGELEITAKDLCIDFSETVAEDVAYPFEVSARALCFQGTGDALG